MTPHTDLEIARAKSFNRYLRMGRDWPQLRGPLAIALLASSALDYPDPISLFSIRHLLPNQVNRTIKTAESLHHHFGIEARKLTADMAQLEWHRALSAATFITFKLVTGHRHKHYDPYHDYIDEADASDLFQIINNDRATFEGAGVHFVNSYNTLAKEGQLAGLFRASYMADHRRKCWLRSDQSPSQLDGGQLNVDVEPSELRKAILRKLRASMVPDLEVINPEARMALAMGIDWKLL